MKPLLLSKNNTSGFLKKREIFFESKLGIKIKQAFDKEAFRNHYILEGKTARIPVKGELIYDNYAFAYWIGGTVTSSLIASVKECLESPNVKEIILDIDSPGGEVGGIQDLSDLIYTNRTQKQFTAHVKGVCFSAAYWIGSACNEITASPYSMLGSIGALYSFYDDSDLLVTLISEVSPKKLASKENEYLPLQKMVNEYGKQFVSHVARNRSVNQAKVLSEYGQGDIFTANEFFSIGAIDSIDGGGHTEKHYKKKTTTTTKMKFKIKSFLKNKMRAGLVIIDDEMIDLPEGSEVMSLDEITTDWIKENLPYVAQELIDEGAGGQDEMNESEPATEPEPETTARLKANLSNVKSILAIETFNEDEGRLQKKAIAAGFSEARFLTELMSLRVGTASRAVNHYQKETNGLDVTPDQSAGERTNKASLIKMAQKSMKSKLECGGNLS